MKNKHRIKTMDLILVFVAVTLIAFSVTMIWLFQKTGNIPDTLVTCVFATLGGECGVMGWIKTTKERNRQKGDDPIERVVAGDIESGDYHYDHCDGEIHNPVD